MNKVAMILALGSALFLIINHKFVATIRIPSFSSTTFTDGKMYCGGGFDGVCDSLTFGTKSDGTFIIRDETSKVNISTQVSPKMIARRIESQYRDPLHIGTYPLTVTLDQDHSGYFVNFLRRHGVQFDLQSIESDRFINIIIQ